MGLENWCRSSPFRIFSFLTMLLTTEACTLRWMSGLLEEEPRAGTSVLIRERSTSDSAKDRQALA